MTDFPLLPSGADSAEQLARLLDLARQQGAAQADAMLATQHSQHFACRQGKVERREQAQSAKLGLRVMVEDSWGGICVPASANLDETALAQRACDLARAQPPDPHARLPQKDFVHQPLADALDLCETAPPAMESLSKQALEAESAALQHKAITNSLGADASFSQTHIARAASNGFAAQWQSSRSQLSCAVLAGKAGQQGEGMVRDYAYAITRHQQNLPFAKLLGEEAASRAAARLMPRPAPTGAAPVLFSRRTARSLLGHLAAALSGPLLARGGSFLKDSLGKQIFPDVIDVVDDPFLPRGLRSRPCDSEGRAGQTKKVIEEGVVQNFFLDGISASRLNLPPSGHATAQPGENPQAAPSNFYLLPSSDDEEAMLAQCGTGFWVHELTGQGANLLTGDYSRGASGFWLEGGKPVFPVSGAVIAGNLKTMFASMVAGGDLAKNPQDDLALRVGMDSPSILIPSMMIASGT